MFLARPGLFQISRKTCSLISQAQCQAVSSAPTRFISQQERKHKEESMWDFLAAIKQCGKSRDLEGGRLLHKEAAGLRCDQNRYVGTALINMYSRCGSMTGARDVFDRMSDRDVVTWTSLIQGYVSNGESFKAMEVYNNMNCERSYVTYVAALKACAGMARERHSDKRECLFTGMRIHEELKARGGLDSIPVVGSKLLDMYSRCGCMKHAREVFNKMPHKDVVSWTCLIVGYVDNGESSRALEVFQSMDCEPDAFTFASALKACAIVASENESERENCLRKGMSIHERLKQHRTVDRVVSTTLLEMYSKCGDMQRAREIFDGMLHRDVISWNSIILGYLNNGDSYAAMELFTVMNCEPNHFTYAAVLKALVCTATKDESQRLSCLQTGMEIHERLKDRGFDSDVVVVSTLVDLYSRCGSMTRAREVFNCMRHRDVVAWTCLISRYTEAGENRSSSMCLAREVFDKMPQRDTATWNSVILGYVRGGESSVAMELLKGMDCDPDSVTFVAALKACTSMALESSSSAEKMQEFLEKGMAIHKEAKALGFDSEIVVANCLVDMYSKCNSMITAQDVFDNMTRRDVVSWTSLVLGYVDNGDSSSARKLFMSMDCEPNCITFVAALRACANLADMQLGQTIHSQVCRLGLEQDQMVVNCLIDFYGKCSNVSAAERLFSGMLSPDIVSWNAMLAGYSILGDTSQVFSLAAGIRDAGLEMTGITFISVLTACSHAGKIEEGRRWFDSMSSRYGVAPTVDHYTCMVDMLGRANRLHEALEVVKTMPFVADTVTWKTLLSACKKWNNVEVAEVAFDALVARNTSFSAPFVLMGDIYKTR